MDSTPVITVKASYKGEIRRFPFLGNSFKSLYENVVSLFAVEGGVALKYFDEENDLVTLTSDLELRSAINGNTLRLEVVAKGGQPYYPSPVVSPPDNTSPFGNSVGNPSPLPSPASVVNNNYNSAPFVVPTPVASPLVSNPSPFAIPVGNPSLAWNPSPFVAPVGNPSPLAPFGNPSPFRSTVASPFGNLSPFVAPVVNSSPFVVPVVSNPALARNLDEAAPMLVDNPRVPQPVNSLPNVNSGPWRGGPEQSVRRNQAPPEERMTSKQQHKYDKKKEKEARHEEKSALKLKRKLEKESRRGDKHGNRGNERYVPPHAAAGNESPTDSVSFGSAKETLSARHVNDVTIEDGCVIPANTPFVKIWRVRNEGVTWPIGCSLLYISKQNGDTMSSPESVAIAVPALSGQEIDISVPLIAPPKAGRYTGYWRLADPNGKKFGQRLWVTIVVPFVGSSSSEGDKEADKFEVLVDAVLARGFAVKRHRISI